MRSVLYFAAICGTVLTNGLASGTTYDSLVLNGTFTDQFRDRFGLSGTLNVDATSGLIADGSLNLVGESWTQIISQQPAGASYDVSIQTPVFNSGFSSSNCGPGCHDVLQLVLSAAPLTLLQEGGSIASGFADLTDAGFSITLVSGTVSATPLPPALPLFIAGAGALALLGWRTTRAKKLSAAAA